MGIINNHIIICTENNWCSVTYSRNQDLVQGSYLVLDNQSSVKFQEILKHEFAI